jgi:hypothetical protein
MFVLSGLQQAEGFYLDLQDAKLIELDNNDERSWPRSGQLFLRGLSYEKIARMDVPKEIAWIRLQSTKSYAFQPYDYLAEI